MSNGDVCGVHRDSPQRTKSTCLTPRRQIGDTWHRFTSCCIDCGISSSANRWHLLTTILLHDRERSSLTTTQSGSCWGANVHAFMQGQTRTPPRISHPPALTHTRSSCLILLPAAQLAKDPSESGRFAVRERDGAPGEYVLSVNYKGKPTHHLCTTGEFVKTCRACEDCAPGIHYDVCHSTLQYFRSVMDVTS